MHRTPNDRSVRSGETNQGAELSGQVRCESGLVRSVTVAAPKPRCMFPNGAATVTERTTVRGFPLFTLCCALAAPVLAWQGAKDAAGKRLFVEPFITKAGPEKFRDGVVAELRKLPS